MCLNPPLREFMLTSTWVIVQDEKQQSAKKRKAICLDKLENEKAEAAKPPPPQFRDCAVARLKEIWPEWFIDSDEESDF